MMITNDSFQRHSTQFQPVSKLNFDNEKAFSKSEVERNSRDIVPVDDLTTNIVTGAIQEAKRVIMAESKGLEHLNNMVGESFPKAAHLLLSIPGRILVTGLGKSGHIARKIASTMTSTGSTAFFLNPGDLNHGDLGAINRGDGIIILSRSGDVPELTQAVAKCHRLSVPIVAITAKPSSKLATAANATLLIPDIPEACPNGMAPTTSALCTLSMGDALALYMMKRRCFGVEDFRMNHPGGNIGRRSLTIRELVSSRTHSCPIIQTVLPNFAVHNCLTGLLCGSTGMVAVLDDNGRLANVLTDRDVGSILMKNFDKNTTIEQILPTLGMYRLEKSIDLDCFKCHENDQASMALAKMVEINLRGVFIVDEGGFAIGFLLKSECLENGITTTAACRI